MAYKIYLSPSDQYGNVYAWGDTNEAVQCNAIAKLCQTALERCGFEVRRHENMFTAVRESNAWGADLHVPIHTNAFDGKVMGTRTFCYALKNPDGSETEGHKAAKAIFDALAPLTIGKSENIKAVPTLYEVKNTSAPCAYVEVDFHDVPSVAKWIIEHKNDIAEAICKGICAYFDVSYVATDDSGAGKTESDTGPSTSLTKPFQLPILKAGSKSREVKTLQAYLKGFGYNIGSAGVDGHFGAMTEAAVKKLQLNNGIAQDGVVGDRTWNAILFNS